MAATWCCGASIAEENVPNNTVAGADEIPTQLIKQLGPKSEAHVTSAIEHVIKTKKIMIRQVRASSSTRAKVIRIRQASTQQQCKR